MSPTTPLAAISPFSKEELKMADKPELVLFVYGLVLIPLALYVLHDIVDNRWRPIHNVVRYNIAYLFLYVVAATFLVGYVVIQWIGSDFKEVGAAVVALILGTYRVWTLLRLLAIISAHRRLVMILKACSEQLNKLSVKPQPFQPIEYFLFRKPPGDVYDRHLYISASLFDDSYPGQSARIRWLSMNPSVHKNDVNECASRIAVWMRIVLGNADMRIWEELTDAKLRTFEKGFVGKLYETLLSEFMSKPAGRAPRHVSKNPGEQLINLEDRMERDHLRKLGAGIFWLAARVRDEEFGHIIAAMPARWTHQTEHTGRQMMFEMGSILMLSAMPIPEGPTGKLIQIKSEDLQKSLLKEESKMIWELITNSCVEAVSAMILQDQDEAESTAKCDLLLNESRIVEVITIGLSSMMDKARQSTGTTRSLRFSMICIIRRAYFGGYIVESVWGDHMNHVYVREGACCSFRLYHAEIVFGLYHVLATLDLCERNLFSKDNIAQEKKPISLRSCDGLDEQDCSASKYREYIKMAGTAAKLVYRSLYDAFEHHVERPPSSE